MGKSSRAKSRGGRLFLVLFSLPFAGVGVFMAVLIGKMLYDAHRMQRWEEVSAVITHAELVVSHGDDSTTYRAEASYTYTYGGLKWRGDRVGLGSGSDNIGKYHHRKHSELESYAQSGQPFRCFVNPDDPSRSILYPEIRFAMLGFYSIFCLVFGGVGFGLLIGGSIGFKILKREQKLQDQNPDEPWKWKEQWASGTIKSSTRAQLIFSCGFAVLWNLISAPVIFFVPDEIRSGNHAAWIALLFPLVGAGLLIWAVRCIIRWSKYGESVFQMASVPGVTGGQLGGVIRTKVNLRPEDGFHLSLRCVRRVTSGSGKNRSTTEHIEWEDSRVVTRELMERDFSQSAIPVQFGIPYDAPETTRDDQNPQIVWRLHISAKVPGIDYDATFEVPVYQTADSSPDFKVDTSMLDGYVETPSVESLITDTGVIMEPSVRGGYRIVFPRGRNPGASFGMTLFFLIWTGICVALALSDAPLIFPIVFGLFDLLFLCVVLDVWLSRHELEVRPGLLIFRGGMFSDRQHSLSPGQIEKIASKNNMTVGTKTYYDVQVRSTDGKSHTLGKRLPSRRAADRLGELIRETLQS